MQVIIYSKDNCPFCVRAKNLLESKGIEFTEVRVTSAEELPNPEFRTVPQIMFNKNFIGGFKELESTLKALELRGTLDHYFTKKPERILFEATPTSKKNTVFNSNNTGHETGIYPLFLGEELGFADSINNPYPILEELYDTQMGQIWNHLEVSLDQDRQDMLTAPKEIVDLMVQNLLWQTLADSVASRAIGSILTKHISNSSLQDLYNAIINFESIHSKTYLHIIRQTLEDPNDALRKGYANINVIKRSNVLVESFDRLSNYKGNDEEALRKLIIFCLLAMYLLESVNFMASFCCTFAIAEAGYFQGISQDVVLICRDEILHARAGANILSIVSKQWPETWKAMLPEAEAMVKAVTEDEYAWADHLFSEGRQLIGLNAKTLKEQVDYYVAPVRKTLGLPYVEITEQPLPFMKDYIDTSRVQSAAQEIQLTAYLVNAVSMVSEDEMGKHLDELRSKYLC